MAYIYIAGPLFDDHEREYLEKIAEHIEGKGHTTFLPHRDAGIIEGEFTLEMRSKVYLDDKVALEACDGVVALLTGRDIDSGTAAEIGFAVASNKKVTGINANNVFFPNNFVWGLLGEGKNIVKSLPALEKALDKLFTS